MSLSNLLIIFSSSFMALFPVINPLGNGFVVNGFFTDLDPQQRKNFRGVFVRRQWSCWAIQARLIKKKPVRM